MKKFVLLIPLLSLMACEVQEPNIEIEVLKDQVSVSVSVSESEEFVCGRDKIKDSDGNEYKTAYFDVDGGHDVAKDGQCWMAENLNVGKVILNPGDEPSDDEVVEKYPNGQYIWAEVVNYDLDNPQGICPSGWIVPSRKDWHLLQEALVVDYDAETLKTAFLEEFKRDRRALAEEEKAVERSLEMREKVLWLLDEISSLVAYAGEVLKYGEMEMPLTGYWHLDENISQGEGERSYWAIRWESLDLAEYLGGKELVEVVPGKSIMLHSDEEVRSFITENFARISFRKRLALFHTVQYMLDSLMFPAEYHFGDYMYDDVTLNVRCVKK